MDDAVNGFPLEEAVQKSPVPDVPLIEPRLGMDCLPVTCFQVIRNHYVSAAVDELVSRVGANVAGPAQY